MGYPNDFIEMLERCSKKGYDDKFIIGGGNPNSNILFVGQEPTGDAEDMNTLRHYLENHKKGIVDKWTRYRVEEEKYFKDQGKEVPPYWTNKQTLWGCYQTLCDIIFEEKNKNRKEVFDFEELVFCSEMNGSPSKRTREANKESIEKRKQFFMDPYFKRFNVIVLACGNYISNVSDNPEEREIDNIFNVRFFERHGKPRNYFWTHYNDDKTRLVIHTRNLSADISRDMLSEMGNLICGFLKTLAK